MCCSPKPLPLVPGTPLLLSVFMVLFCLLFILRLFYFTLSHLCFVCLFQLHYIFCTSSTVELQKQNCYSNYGIRYCNYACGNLKLAPPTRVTSLDSPADIDQPSSQEAVSSDHHTLRHLCSPSQLLLVLVKVISNVIATGETRFRCAEVWRNEQGSTRPAED